MIEPQAQSTTEAAVCWPCGTRRERLALIYRIRGRVQCVKCGTWFTVTWIPDENMALEVGGQ